jgi:hypothetical protein
MENPAIKAAYDKAYFKSLRGTKEGIRIGTSPEYNYYKNLASLGIKLDDPIMDVLKPHEADFKITCDPFTTTNASRQHKVSAIIAPILAKLNLLGHEQLIKNAGINPDWIIGYTDNPCLGGLRFIRDVIRNLDKIDTPIKRAEREALRMKQRENAMERRRLAIAQKEAELAALKANDPFGLYNTPPVRPSNITSLRGSVVSALSKPIGTKSIGTKSRGTKSKSNNDPFGIYTEKKSEPELLIFPNSSKDLEGLFGGKSKTKRKNKNKNKKSKNTRKH